VHATIRQHLLLPASIYTRQTYKNIVPNLVKVNKDVYIMLRKIVCHVKNAFLYNELMFFYPLAIKYEEQKIGRE